MKTWHWLEGAGMTRAHLCEVIDGGEPKTVCGARWQGPWEASGGINGVCVAYKRGEAKVEQYLKAMGREIQRKGAETQRAE